MASQEINVFGWYNQHNIGDEAYKLAFPLLFPNYTFSFTSEHLSSDFCIVGGGDIINSQFLKRISPVKRKVAISVSLPHDISPKVCEQFSTMIVRDKETAHRFPHLHYYPDITFVLKPNKDKGTALITSLFKSHKADLYHKKIGIIVNGNLIPKLMTPAYQEKAFEYVINSLAEVIDSTNASFIFIPFGTSLPNDDSIANGYVAAKCKFFNKNVLIKDEVSVQDTLNIISACDLIISTRLHSSIFSCIAAVPFIDILHNHKNLRFTHDISYFNTMSFWDFNKAELIHKIHHIQQNYNDISDSLAQTTQLHKNLLKDLPQHVHLI